MSEQDRFETLLEALRGDIPVPDHEVRRDVIAIAVKKFPDQPQETPDPLRQKDYLQVKRPSPLSERIAKMKTGLKTALFGGTAIATTAAATFVVVLFQGSPAELESTLSIAEVAPKSALNAQGGIQAPVIAPAPELELAARAEYVADAAIMDLATDHAAESMIAGNSMSVSKMAMAPAVAVQSPGQLSLSHPVEDFDIVENVDESRFDGEEIEAVKLVSEEPVSTFSVDVDTASYAYMRRMIDQGVTPSPESVRIEEMLNYFPYSYTGPEVDSADPFATHIAVFESPWNANNELVRIGIQGMQPEIENRPALDLVFLIDTSGSMNSADKLGLLKKSLIMMLPELRPQDRIGIVTYAGSAGVVLEMTPATEEDEIVAALAALNADGSTAGAAGLEAAYGLLTKNREDGRIGRVLLATDGDFNVGMSSTEDMKSYIEKQREDGAYLSVLGYGTGNYNDALMQTLAQNGNGTAAYIDSLSEARKVLVDQLSGALFPIANDVKIQVEWNPEAVREYRLIGYETRILRREDFNNDKVDAGEIGAGHQVTALYEVALAGSEGGLISPSRYGDSTVNTDPDAPELGYVNIRYKHPGDRESVLLGTPILRDAGVDEDALWAASIAGFGQLMKDDRYLGDWGYADAAALAKSALGDDSFGYRHEALQLMNLVEVLDR
jgi:Ca-activated chloride channel family protein